MTSFSFLSATHHLEIVDRHSTTFRSRHVFTIMANVDSRFLVREYQWTGSGVERETLPEVASDIDKWGIPFHRMHGPILVEGSSRTMVVDLGRTVKVGETERVEFVHRMKDLAGTFQPYFLFKPSTRIRDKLTIRLTFPKWEGLKCVYEVFQENPQNIVVREGLLTVERMGGLYTEKQILNPSGGGLGHVVRWSHEDH